MVKLKCKSQVTVSTSKERGNTFTVILVSALIGIVYALVFVGAA